jgi:hypothetical protein
MCKQIKRSFMCIVFLLTACGRNSDCPGCDDMTDVGASPDLPCGGADLQNDNSNCGECGEECVVWYEGSPYEVGGCQAGQCGPVWYEGDFDLVSLYGPPPPDTTCDEICESHSTSCVPRGCSGKTGYVCATIFGEGCSLSLPDIYPVNWYGDCSPSRSVVSKIRT